MLHILIKICRQVANGTEITGVCMLHQTLPPSLSKPLSAYSSSSST